MSVRESFSVSADPSGLASRRIRFWLRVFLAGPLVAATSFAVLAGGALWMPMGPAQIDHLLMPLIMFPAVWAALFFHACLVQRLGRAYALHGALLLLNGILIARHLWAGSAS
jgi:hypothetical protein